MRTKALRESTSIEPTTHDKGLELTIRVKAYDNGQLYIDGQPMNDETGAAWAFAIANAAEKIGMLNRAMTQRERERLSA